jgi:hypothetical protein
VGAVALTADTHDRCGVRHYAYLPACGVPATWSASPCVRLSRTPWPDVTPSRVGCPTRSQWIWAFSGQPPSEPGVPAFQAPGSPAITPRARPGRARGERQGPLRVPALRIPHGCFPFIACAPSPCGPSLAVSRLGGRYPADYFGHSVAIGLASRRRSHVHHCCTCRARFRRPVRLLQYPDRASLLHPRGLQRASRQLAAGAGTGFRRLSGRFHIAPSGD